ncbi:hypothetical protein ACFPER_18345 [Agromyces aurantiacus]|uniref:Uncharacterized protein n=1 Tax=Agromyces aurantiacus TaxID=165814 RepID=A0ABV9RAK6_9MICO|nr:hypothetical protein [Agromyces aurantiacus]MBM7505451.1 hypothetical protein [Agromyces aurantiacus]
MDADERTAAEAYVEESEAARLVVGTDPVTAKARADADREDAELARRELAGGLDPERLDALAEERSKARRALADAAHRRAVDASEAIGRRLVDLTPVLPVRPDDPMNVIIDRVTFIRTYADAGVVVDSNVGSLDSWARYRFDSTADAITGSGTGRLSFYTLWRNPRTSPVVVTGGARLVVNAHLSTDADWNGVAAWFIGGSEARATVRARVTFHALWDSAINAIVHDRILADAGATGGFFGGDDSASIAFNEFLTVSGFAVPAQASVLIEVELLTEWVATSGAVRLDAESGAFRVSVPHLILTLT